MTGLGEQVCEQASLLVGGLGAEKQALLRLLCASAVASLTARLREGVTPADCQEDFLAAASLYALAALDEAGDEGGIQEFRAGDLTVKGSARPGGTAARCLRREAEVLIGPHLKDRFCFQGV